MSQSSRKTTYDKNRRSTKDSRSEYIYGNAVRKLEPQKRLEERPAKKPHPEVRKNRERAHHMNPGYVLFLTAALCAAALILVNYIQMQSDLIALTRTAASRESELNHLKMANDEEYNRIINSIDLEEIKRIAMGELGMVYAKEDQIIIYEGESNDYMRQVKERSQ